MLRAPCAVLHSTVGMSWVQHGTYDILYRHAVLRRRPSHVHHHHLTIIRSPLRRTVVVRDHTDLSFFSPGRRDRVVAQPKKRCASRRRCRRRGLSRAASVLAACSRAVNFARSCAMLRRTCAPSVARSVPGRTEVEREKPPCRAARGMRRYRSPGSFLLHRLPR